MRWKLRASFSVFVLKKMVEGNDRNEYNVYCVHNYLNSFTLRINETKYS